MEPRQMGFQPWRALLSPMMKHGKTMGYESENLAVVPCKWEIISTEHVASVVKS